MALLTSSSLVAAGLTALVSAGAALAPATARAQTATCISTTSPVIGGDGSAAVTLPAGTYNPGLTCTYTGDTAAVSTTGAITVSTAGGVPADPLINGVNLRATGADDINWTSTAGTVTGGNQTNGPVIDARTAGGNITLNTGAVTGSNATITHGIYAESAAGGTISITATGAVSASNSTSGQAAIEAISTGGNGDVTINTTTSISGGRLYGIRAQTSGSGDLTINATSVSQGSNVAGGVAAIDATTGTGLLTITATGSVGNSGGVRTQGALRINTGGDAVLNFSSILSGRGGDVAVVDMTTTAGTQTTLNHFGLSTPFSNQPSGAGPRALAFRVSGGGDVTINTVQNVSGRADFSGHTGDLDWTFGGQWFTTDLTTFGSGGDTITVGDTGFLILTHNEGAMQGSSENPEPANIMDFGAGDDTLVNRGFLMLATRRGTSGSDRYFLPQNYESETRFVGLETLENHGTIVMGTQSLPGAALPSAENPADYYDETDIWRDDVLVLPGTTFIGGDGSRIVFDTSLIFNQPACDPSLRNMVANPAGDFEGSMPAADCVSIPGGATEGQTLVALNLLGQGDRGGPVRIVLVDVAGGTSAAGHFILDPETPLYTDDQGGYLDLGYFIMPLVYDPETQQHALVGVPGQNALQQAAWAQSAHDLWRVSTGSWLDRQADLRGADMAGVGGGVWLRVNGQTSQRDLTNTVTEGASTFVFNNGYDQSSYAVTGGLDLMAGGGANSAWVVGLTAGYTNAEMDYAASPNTGQLDGWTGGAYATYIAGGLFVDAIVNANRLEMIADVPGLNLSPEGTLLDTRLLSVGGQVEAGWRLPFGGGVFVEPLAGVSYVRTKWDEMEVPSDDLVREGVMVDFGDPTSLRASLGARLGLDQDYGAFRAQYSLLGRVSEEFEGETSLTLDTIVDDAFVSDAFTGRFGEFGVAANLYGMGDAVSGFAQFGGKFGDDYTAQTMSVGVRVAW